MTIPRPEHLTRTVLRLVLASGSPRRREILREIGIDHEVHEPSGVDESAVTGSADHVCVALARAKAEWVWARRTTFPVKANAIDEFVVIGADTVVAIDDPSSPHGEELLGKPTDDADARRILARLAGRTHRVLTGIAVVDAYGTRSEYEESRVTFRAVSPSEIDAYVATGEPRGKAGAYGIQSGGARLVAGFTGCYYNIVGLPWRRLLRLLGPDFARVAPNCDCGVRPLQIGIAGCLQG
jgi:septum formation protein